jgi:hypothetical protein
MKSCFEFESTNWIAKKDTKITVHAKTYVKSNVGGALFFGGFFPELISAWKTDSLSSFSEKLQVGQFFIQVLWNW